MTVSFGTGGSCASQADQQGRQAGLHHAATQGCHPRSQDYDLNVVQVYLSFLGVLVPFHLAPHVACALAQRSPGSPGQAGIITE